MSNNEEAWVYHYYFSEPVPALYVQFSADQSEGSQCLYGLTLSGCTLGMDAKRDQVTKG